MKRSPQAAAELTKAVAEGDWDTAERLLIQGTGYNAKWEGQTTLTGLFEARQWKLMQHLPAKAFHERMGNTRLLHAVLSWHSWVSDPNLPGCGKPHRELLEHLLSDPMAGQINWNLRDGRWNTPLHSYMNGRHEFKDIKRLVELKANPGLKNGEGLTPLDHAILGRGHEPEFQPVCVSLLPLLPIGLPRTRIPKPLRILLAEARRLAKARQELDSSPRQDVMSVTLDLI